MTLTTLEMRNTLDEETLEVVMIIGARPDGSEVKVRSDGPVPEAVALSGEFEPNKGFTKLLTLLLAQFRLVYHLKKLTISRAASQGVDVPTLPERSI